MRELGNEGGREGGREGGSEGVKEKEIAPWSKYRG